MRQFAIAILLLFITMAVFAQSATFTKQVITPNCWSTNKVIATSTQQNAIATYQNFVFLAFYNSDRKLSIARNSNHGEGTDWKIIELPHTYEQRNGTWDNHNTPNIIVSPNDERIHLSFDMHARDLRYIISSENAATVSDADFKASLFSPTRAYLEASQLKIQKVTYPRFFIGEEDQLFFMYRTGGSGNGDTYMAKYKDDGYWNKPVEIIDGNIGSYNGHGDRCAYFNNVHFKDGRIYLTWVWRETPDGATNHDIMFAYSEDDGQTWKNSDGVSVSRPMNLNSPGVKIATLPTDSGLSNHNGCAVDGHGNVHVVSRYDGTYLHHFGVREGSKFNWSEQTITTFSGDRPKMYCDQTTNDLYFLVRQGNSLRLFATPENGEQWDQWSEVASDSDLYMTSTNSYMNAEGNVLTSMVVSTDGRLQLIRWALDSDSPKIDLKEEPEEVLKSQLNGYKGVYPNPSENGIYHLSTSIEYKVYDVTGTLIMEGKGNHLNLTEMRKGVYLLESKGEVIRLIKR